MVAPILTGSVGFGGRAANRHADVKAVQHLFNLLGGGETLPEDGQCSPALVARIGRFQREALHFPHPDSRIDPHGRTLATLLSRAAERARTRPTAGGESWGQRAAETWASLTHAMDQAWGALFATETRTSQVNRPSTAGRAAGAAAGSTAGAAAGASGAPAQVGVSAQDYANVAAQLGPGVDPLLIRAFAQVESGGKSGFNAAGLPIIAYEGHWFRKYTHHLYDETHPLLSYPYVKKAGWQWQINNKDQTAAWKTLNEAMALNAAAALQSTSWGMCQVMGFNYQACGYHDVFAFVAAMKQGSLGQLQAFAGFCKGKPGMVAALVRKDYATMARLYNGNDYGDYDRRIARAYARLGGN